MIPPPENRLIVAIDRSDMAEALALATQVRASAGMLKVGLELFWGEGPTAVTAIAALGPVFVDAKLHDIPNTVERAAANIAKLGVAMVTVHALGGPAMVAAAVRGVRRGAQESHVDPPKVVALTVLSSQSGEELASPASLAFEAKDAGADGVVVSGADVHTVRDVCGPEFTLVVPGIRPGGTNGDDQVRVLTPAEAVEAGADYLVIGRPITDAADPAAAARSILSSI